LAHEEILQALMAQLAEGDPRFLDRLRERLAGARRGAHEHDYTEAFLHEVCGWFASVTPNRPINLLPPREPCQL
jgi:hypothetical protein